MAVSSREWQPRIPEVENLVWQYSSSLPTGLVEVSFPCWCMRKCRVTVPWAASASTVFPSGQTSTLVIIPSEPNPTNHKGAFVQTVKPKSQRNCSSAIKTGADYRRKFMSLTISLRRSSPKFCRACSQVYWQLFQICVRLQVTNYTLHANFIKGHFYSTLISLVHEVSF